MLWRLTSPARHPPASSNLLVLPRFEYDPYTTPRAQIDRGKNKQREI